MIKNAALGSFFFPYITSCSFQVMNTAIIMFPRHSMERIQVVKFTLNSAFLRWTATFLAAFLSGNSCPGVGYKARRGRQMDTRKTKYGFRSLLLSLSAPLPCLCTIQISGVINRSIHWLGTSVLTVNLAGSYHISPNTTSWGHVHAV